MLGSDLFTLRGGRISRARNLRRAGTWALAVPFFLCGGPLRALPVVGSFSPALGRPGTQVVINGSGFATATLVKFDTAPADFTVASDTRMTATVPVDATIGPIRITNPTGTANTANDFLVAPRITGFSPARSATNMVVIVEGFNFAVATNVLFNSRRASFWVTAPTQIHATVPFGATNGPITVQTAAGTATSTNHFTVTGPAPIIDSFYPGVSAPGADILIFGANFTNVTAVQFGNAFSSRFPAPAQTLIQAQVPPAATTGKITVRTGAGSASSTDTFVVTRAPVITNFFPKFGVPLATFPPVTIEGINFTNITGVGFSGKAANWGRLAENQLFANVPAAATN